MKNKWIFLFVFVAVNCMVIKAQEIFFEGIILFYYNTHPSDLISDGSYFALDSVRLITSKEKYAVWSDFSQKEVFMQDSSSKNYVSGKNFKIWDSVPQYSSIKSRNNYEHIGGDIYYDKENEIVIAFRIKGKGYMSRFDRLKTITPMNDTTRILISSQLDSSEVAESVWHNFSTQNKNEEYVIFVQINDSKSLRKKQYKNFGLKKKRIKHFLLYGT